MHFESLRPTDRVSHILIIFLCISFSVFCSLCNMHILSCFYWSVLKPKSAFTCMSTKSLFFWISMLYTHTYLTARFPGLPGWAGTRKVKPIWILLKQETVSGSGISWAICKHAPRSRQITTPAPHHSVFTARCYASVVLAMGLCLSVCVYPSVTSRSSTKTAKRRITQTTTHDTLGV